MTKIIKVNLGERTYPIIIQNGLLGKIGTLNVSRSMRDYTLYAHRFVIITDKNVASFYLNKVINSLKRAGLKSIYRILPAGENQKSLSTANKLYDFLIKHRIERQDIIIALGGGVIGDLAGFVAATYKRGLKLIQVPTSLIAQVDSSIGGKTAVNHPSGKNLIGVFHQPSFVLIDPLVLKTLPKQEFYNGMAEVIKAAIIKDSKLFRILKDNHKEIIKLEPKVLETMLIRAIRVKKDIVEQDERDTKGIRVLLNYGHTIGHILEASEEYKSYPATAGWRGVYPAFSGTSTHKHGEAIAIGMMVSARIAQEMKLVDDDFIKQQSEILKIYNLPTIFTKPLKFSRVVKFLEQDKKIKAGKIWEVLPNLIGSAKAYQIPLIKFKSLKLPPVRTDNLRPYAL